MQAKQKKWLKGQAHSLKPVVIIGSNGLTENVHKEINLALDIHELIKIRISHKERELRKTIADEIIAHHKADLINTIGHIIIIFRENEDK